jgi:hypothetical protein
MGHLRRSLRCKALIDAVGSFTEMIVPVLVFTLFVRAGGSLDLTLALTAMEYFGRLLSGLSNFPSAQQSYNEMVLAFDRLETFLEA